MNTTFAPSRSSHFQSSSPADRHASDDGCSNVSHDVDPAKQEISICGMVGDLSTALETAILEIHGVNAETKVLALNARIEAARAGQFGAAFGVVAEEIQVLSDKTSKIADQMARRTREKTAEYTEMIDRRIRGTRLSDLALVNIDLIDRNLYERTCDVRWWATDGSLVDALTSETEQSREFASHRLGVILSAYTVYHDLVLCDCDGRIVANGRPEKYTNVGFNESSSDWFRAAMATGSGDEYGFQSAHQSPIVSHQPSLIYSCAVREGANARGKKIGVLGIVFDWMGLAQPILENIPVDASEKSTTCAYILDRQGCILASNRETGIGQRLDLREMDRLRNTEKGFFVTDIGGRRVCVGHAQAPGFETYSTGWLSVVTQPISG